MPKAEAKKIALAYADKLRFEKFPFTAIYLFGSYAKGKPTEFSDIDIAVISDKLKTDWNKNEEKLWAYTMSVNSKIEPVGMTVAEFADLADPLASAIKKTGIKVA
ncbi:MAG: nucleotidyltransferase domain-containing protein [Candidatus Falkowbacteria bacterium]